MRGEIVMSAPRTPALVRNRVYGVAASLILASGVVAGCGPSQDEIRADISAFREDTAPEPREDGYQASAET